MVITTATSTMMDLVVEVSAVVAVVPAREVEGTRTRTAEADAAEVADIMQALQATGLSMTIAGMKEEVVEVVVAAAVMRTNRP
jgi:hypothetical protein